MLVFFSTSLVTYIVYCLIIVYILSSLLCKKLKTFYRTEKKIEVKVCTKPLLWNANYDRENDDSTNALRPRRFK